MDFAELKTLTSPTDQTAPAIVSRNFGLPSTERLLLEGGDARIALTDGASNKYGCFPRPDPGMLAFGSSTASTISEAGFEAANALRRELLIATKTEAPDAVYAREVDRIRLDLEELCGTADLPGSEIIFAASGTDLHLIAAQLVAGSDTSDTLVIMVDGEETGRGVPLAVSGRHFNARTALGESVAEGKAVAGSAGIEVATVAVRLADGSPREAGDIDQEVESLAKAAIAHHRKVLLVLADVTKTGMIAPSISCAMALHRLPGEVEIMVDACQFRIAGTTLRSYLEHGFMVAITGSKFLTGPTFAGALFLPSRSAKRLRNRRLPSGLSAYSSQADWPTGWNAARSLPSTENFGLLLRWEAALEEFRAFHAVPESEVEWFLREFASAVQARIANDPSFSALPVPVIDRSPLNRAESWDRLPTVFPFVPHYAGTLGRTPLSREKTAEVYRLLQLDLSSRPDAGLPEFDTSAGLRCQLGQPVTCGMRNGIPVSALRLCASARLAVEATAQNRKNAQAVIERALSALDKVALLAAAIG